MKPSAVLINQPAIDFKVFLGLAHQMLGFNPSSKVDSSTLIHSDTERFLSCLAAIREGKPTPNLLTHVSFSILIAGEERDLIDILVAASGMPVDATETISRGVMMAVISGTLAQWRDAVKTGTDPSGELNVRALYCHVMSLFQEAGLGFVWSEFNTKPLNDNTFYLEDKRTR